MDAEIINFGEIIMANRPVFTLYNSKPYIKETIIEFKFYNGFSEKQKRLSIDSLHKSILNNNMNSKVLEISSKSDNPLGIKLSAFNLKIKTKNEIEYTIETLFQSSKVFENGGPYRDILNKSSKDAKKDERLKNSGKIIEFNCFGNIFNISPKTYFYDWLYVNAVYSNKYLSNEILKYNAFTDIEFNPNKSINCQAKSAALYVSLYKNGLIEKALKSKEDFLFTVYDNININYKLNNQLNIWDIKSNS
jgi:hypothetical protein